MSLKTPIGIISFPVLFTPRALAGNMAGGEPRFSCSLLFDAVAQKTPEFLAMRKAVAQAIDERWGKGKSQDKAFLSKIRMPFRKCSDKTYDGYDIPGGVYISPWTKTRPGIVDANRQEITVPGDVWAGQSARATVNCRAYAQQGNQGVHFLLNNVQICRTDGRRLDGRKSALEDFEEFSDVGALDSTVEEEIPF